MKYVESGGALKYGDLLNGFLKWGDMGVVPSDAEGYASVYFRSKKASTSYESYKAGTKWSSKAGRLGQDQEFPSISAISKTASVIFNSEMPVIKFVVGKFPYVSFDNSLSGSIKILATRSAIVFNDKGPTVMFLGKKPRGKGGN